MKVAQKNKGLLALIENSIGPGQAAARVEKDIAVRRGNQGADGVARRRIVPAVGA